MVDQAIVSVAEVARSRDRELRDLLERRQQRLEGFLTSLQSLCAERNPSGALGLEDGCMRAAVSGLHVSERALTTDIRYRDRRRVRLGERRVIDTPFPRQPATTNAISGAGRYAMPATRGDLTVEIEFHLDDINAIFSARPGPEGTAQTFPTHPFRYQPPPQTHS